MPGVKRSAGVLHQHAITYSADASGGFSTKLLHLGSSAGEAQDSAALVSLAHVSNSGHPRSVVALVVGLHSVIMKHTRTSGK